MRKNILLFSACLLLAGVFSAFNQQENWWDFFNYHYYNGWAAFTGNTFNYFMLTGVNTYLNPWLDVFTYLLVDKFNHYPSVIFFIQGLWTGALWFLVYKLARLLMPKANLLVIVAALCFALLGHAVVRQIGTSTNEIPVCVMFLTGFYVFLKNYVTQNSAKSLLPAVIAGLLMGAAVGLKLTVAPTVFALFLVFTAMVIKERKKYIFKTYCVTVLATFFGFLLINGMWMWQLWQEFANPFFPYWNNIFESPLLNSDSFRDTRFLPKKLFDIIFLPLHCIIIPTWLMTDIPTSSMFLSIILLSMCVIPCLLLFWKDNKAVKIKFDKCFYFLLAFWWVDYLLWVNMFAILRYAIVIEVVGGILLVYFIQKVLKNGLAKKIVFSILIAAAVIMGCNHGYFLGRDVKNGYLPDIKKLAIDKDSVIAINEITAVLLPLMPKNSGFIRLKYGLDKLSKQDPDRKVLLLTWSFQKLYKGDDKICIFTGFNFPRPVFMCGVSNEKTGVMEGIPVKELKKLILESFKPA